MTTCVCYPVAYNRKIIFSKFDPLEG